MIGRMYAIFMESIGETSPSKEFEAYLTQSIFNEVFRKYYGK